jgi:hypothetical protein
MGVLLGSVWTALTILLLVAVAGDVRAEPAAAASTSSATAAGAGDGPAGADADQGERLDEIEEKVDILTEEMGRIESIFAVPEETQFEIFNGLGPAASKVYKKDRGLSIGGYGEVRLRTYHNTDENDQNNIFDALRAVLYVGYKFNDNWVINSEFEFEHGGTDGGGETSVEFLTVDYLWKEELNARVGLVLIPMGLVNEIHEPTFYYGAERPEVERVLLPSTWRENGGGVFGHVGDRLTYRAYVVNGMDATGFSSSGIRGGRQDGSEALADDFAFVGRADVDIVPGLFVGGSVYAGKSGQDQDVADRKVPGAFTTIYELHASYKGYGATVRGLWTETFIDQAGRLSRVLEVDSNASVAQHMRGFYVEAAYDILPLVIEQTRMSLEPFFRFEKYDTQRDISDLGFERDRSKEVDLYEAGLQFKPIPQIVFKLDYRHFDPAKGSGADEVEAAVGYVF